MLRPTGVYIHHIPLLPVAQRKDYHPVTWGRMSALAIIWHEASSRGPLQHFILYVEGSRTLAQSESHDWFVFTFGTRCRLYYLHLVFGLWAVIWRVWPGLNILCTGSVHTGWSHPDYRDHLQMFTPRQGKAVIPA